jgi:adenosylcobinamide-phosphate guanylyltransferase
VDALVMCGGEGSRLDAPVEKPLFEVGGHPMIGHVLAALEASGVDAVHAAVSPQAPDTQSYLAERSVPRIETPGEGYVADLDRALASVETPVLTVAADLPLIGADAVDRVLAVHDRESVSVCVPAALKRVLGVSVGLTFGAAGRELAPAGINILTDRGGETTHVTHDVRFAVNVNRRSDAQIAEALL